MSYRRHDPPQPLLIGYDPVRDLPLDHLARLVEHVVEATVRPPRRDRQAGNQPYDPRLCVKILVYGYATGVRSSRQLERQCRESLPYLFLTRGAAPSYHTLCTARTEQGEYLEAVWNGLFTVAAAAGLERLGRIAVDSTKLRADASPDAVVKRAEYVALQAELRRILAEAAEVDAQEAQTGGPGRTELGKVVPHEQMRDILRRVRKQQRAAASAASAASAAVAGEPGLVEEAAAGAEPGGEGSQEPGAPGPRVDAPPPQPRSAQMLQRISAGLQAVQAAEAEGRKHLCLTDPDARMMYGERRRGLRESHSFEVATDNGLLVAAGTTQETHDQPRLLPLVAAAAAHEPAGVSAVDADSGYYSGEAVAALLRAGVDTCIPDPNTAGDLHRGRPIGTTQAQTRGNVTLVYDAATDTYACPEGNQLARTQHRRAVGQNVTVYRAQQPCTECPQRGECLTQAHARHRTLLVADDQELLHAARQRFREAEQQDRYHHRGEQVETVFGFLRGTLGYLRWYLRGAKKVACEARWFQTAYQFRKVQRVWAG